MQQPARIGFVGLGLMGLPMALRLIAAGHAVTVWNRSAEKAAPAIAAGASLAQTPAELAAASEVVMACLTDARAVEAVLFGPQGIAAQPGPELLVDFSSMDPGLTGAFAARLGAANGMGWVDAPVSGGTPAAKAGTLTVMAGGSASDFARAEPLMAPVAARVTHMGPVGSGQMTKLVNQIISGCTMAVVAEAVHFAQAAGVDASRLTEALAGGFADSKPFQLLAPRMAARRFDDPLGTVAMMLKDLDTVAETGAAQGAIPLPMTEQARALMQAAVRAGRAEADISTIVLSLAEDVTQR
ncbi:MAG: NAD(P)-dependent oxidoreductase [Pseudomonadota bacterium]